MAHLNPSFSSSSSSSSSNTASTSSTRFSRQPPSPFLPDSTWNTHGLLPYTGSSGFTYPDSFPSSHESNNGSHFGNNHFFEKSSPQNTLPTSLTPTLSTFHPMSQHHDVFHNTSFQTYEPGRSPLQNTIPHSSPSPTIPQLLPVSSSHPPSSSSSLSLSSVFPSSSSTSSSLPLKPMTLEEVEQQLFLQHHHSRPSSATGSRSTSIQPSPTSSYISSPLSYSTSTSTHSFTLEEVEKLIIHHHHQHHPHPHPTYALATNDMDQLVEIRKSAREANMRRLSKYNGIMSRYERDQVTRIHISQLVTDNPMVDDFYYQIYTTMRGGPSTMDAIRYKPPLLQRGVRNASLQEQVERILENAKLKPKATQCKC
ncbi:hypothetical protein HMI56_002174 [Coelomomyces lativittatus]|nr:hypothetical protein HMI56_002174 [Coelomomyces lativittatus]